MAGWFGSGEVEEMERKGAAFPFFGLRGDGCVEVEDGKRRLRAVVLDLFVAERKGTAEKKMKTGGGWFGWPVFFGSEKSNRGATPGDQK